MQQGSSERYLEDQKELQLLVVQQVEKQVQPLEELSVDLLEGQLVHQ